MTDESRQRSSTGTSMDDPYAAFVRRFRDPVGAYSRARSNWEALTRRRKAYRRELFAAYWPYATLAVMGVVTYNLDHPSDKAPMIGMCFLMIYYVFFHTLFALYWALRKAFGTRRMMRIEAETFRRCYGIDVLRHPPTLDVEHWRRRHGLGS